MNNYAITAPTIVLPKNSREELRVSLDPFKGHNLVSLRVWYRSQDGDMRPTKKGVALQVANLPAVIAALSELQALSDVGESQCS